MNEARSNRQRQIINESIKLIHNKGIQGLTIKNISESIKLTEGAIYRHFKSKDDILSAILDDFKNNLGVSIQKILSSDFTAMEKLKAVLNNLIDKFCSNPYIVSVIFSDEIFVNKEILHNKIINLIKQNNDCFVKIAQEGQKSKEIRNDIHVDELSIIIMGSFRMIVKNWQLNKHAYSLQDKGDDLFVSLSKIISTPNN
ncbi:MAG: TetR family transcriptional regulator [Bacteroidales bacterium]|nr:TetR family transcriptional regulator [Bacteroidales bacterium]